MDRLRPRNRPIFSGFTNAEIEKMERLLRESRERSLDREFCHKLAINFNRSTGRAGKPAVKWSEIQSWFQTRLQDLPEVPKNESMLPKDPECKEGQCSVEENNETECEEVIGSNEEMKKSDIALYGLFLREIVRDSSEMEFEAKSSKDGAWYDIETFLAHRFLSNGEAEVLVRFVGFGAEEDEWVTVKNSVRKRSVPLENTECSNLKVGDLVLCFQERKDQAIYYDAHIVEIQRRMHDIRGCRCLILIRYDHDNSEETVRLRRLCRRPRS